MIVYFSGTGNSAWCAHWLAERLEDEVVDAARLMKADEVGRFSSRKPWVFVAPTYSWQLPDVFARWLRTCSFAGSFRAYFVLTCGSDIGNAGAYLEGLCHDLGFVYQGVLPVVMPENYLALFPVPGEEEARGIVEAAKPTLEEGLERIRTNDTFPPVLTKGFDRFKSGPAHTFFYWFVVKDRAFRTTDACDGCGKCVRDCPLNDIELRDGRPVWLGRCTHCMACITGCPKEAIEYGKRSVGRPRYRCPKGV